MQASILPGPDQAMTAFQVNPDWYEQYWSKPASHGSAFEDDRPTGPIDFDFHRARAARERALARQQICHFLLARTIDAIRRVVWRLGGRGMPVQCTGTKV